MANQLLVPIGQIVTSNRADDVLVVYGLGSCVAVILYDPRRRLGGMLHALLPFARSDNGRLPKFVDQGIPLLLEQLLELGARRPSLITYLIGGSQIVPLAEFNSELGIGARNVEAAQTTLQQLRLPIKAQAIGGTAGRSVRLYISNGQVTVKSLGGEERVLS